VTLIDVNLLVYAYHADAPQHRTARRWLEEILSGDEVVGLAWAALWGFVRLSTNPRVMRNPTSPKQAFEIVRGWLEHPGVVLVEPGPRHLDLLQRLVVEDQAG